MRAEVDADRCQGHARCWTLCPGVFALDDEGMATVTVDTVPPELEGQAQAAADNCPERAISLHPTA